MITIRPYIPEDEKPVADIWNYVVEEHDTFPQTEPLQPHEADAFFRKQTYTGVAVDENNEIACMYILHPNNVGRCGHIANASYAVRHDIRGDISGKH